MPRSCPPDVGRRCRPVRRTSAGHGPAQRAVDRPRARDRSVEVVVAAVGVGLQDAGARPQMPGGMGLLAVARGEEQRGRRRAAGEGPVVADIGPDVPLDVVPRASSGTVVSSPCSRSAASTWRSIRAWSGSSDDVAGADQVGQGRHAELDALAGVALAQPVQRLVLAELLDRIIASRFGPAQPRGVAWNGAGGWVIVSQSRHENFSRTVWITFHCRESPPASR